MTSQIKQLPAKLASGFQSGIPRRRTTTTLCVGVCVYVCMCMLRMCIFAMTDELSRRLLCAVCCVCALLCLCVRAADTTAQERSALGSGGVRAYITCHIYTSLCCVRIPRTCACIILESMRQSPACILLMLLLVCVHPRSL